MVQKGLLPEETTPSRWRVGLEKSPRWRVGLVLALPGLFLVLMGCSAERGEEYRSEEGRFVVRLPGRPVEHEQDAKGVSKITLPQQSGEYTVAWQDLPPGDTTSVEARLDGSLKALKGTEIRRRPLLLQGKYHGQEMVADWTKGRVKWRVYLVGNRLYTLVVSGMPWWVEFSASDAFLDSFAVIDPPE
jgi:hypothetical protein